MRWVVLDEADLLMGGGFQRDVNAVLSAMKDEDTNSKAEIISNRLDIDVDTFYSKPRGERKKVLQGMVEIDCLAINTLPQYRRAVQSSFAVLSVNYWVQFADLSRELLEDLQQEKVSSTESALSRRPLLPKSGWWRQFIFVAATLPDDNEKSPGAKIKGVSFLSAKLPQW